MDAENPIEELIHLCLRWIDILDESALVRAGFEHSSPN